MGGSFLIAVVLLAAGVQIATLPSLAFLGVVLLVCALELAFLMPFLWNRVFQYPKWEPTGPIALRRRT